MRSYKHYLNDDTIVLGTLDPEIDVDLTEGLLRSISAVGLISKIRRLSADVKKTKSVNKQLELIASQNTHLGALMFAMTQFKAEKKS
jgi:hypothetical protein